MRFKFLSFILILFISFLNFACSSAPEPIANSTNVNIANAPATNNQTETKPEVNSNQKVLTTKATPEIATTNEAPTLTPIYKAFCEAMRKKDEAGLRKVLTKDTQDYWESEMKAEGKKIPLVQYISETEPITDVSKCGVRNEKITGNTALAEIRNENVPNGFVIKFVKVNGEWKITNESPEFKN